MTEKDALKKFSECAANNDLAGACEALKHVSSETINFRDDDDYDMLIQETVNGSPCAVEALLKDGRCDLSHRENLCGNTAYEFSLDYAPDSRIRRLFQMKKYNSCSFFNFFEAVKNNDTEAVNAHLATGEHPELNKNFIYSMPPGFMFALPLSIAVEHNCGETVKILLAHGAAPDAYCRKNEKTPRQTAGAYPEMLKLIPEAATEDVQ